MKEAPVLERSQAIEKKTRPSTPVVDLMAQMSEENELLMEKMEDLRHTDHEKWFKTQQERVMVTSQLWRLKQIVCAEYLNNNDFYYDFDSAEDYPVTLQMPDWFNATARKMTPEKAVSWLDKWLIKENDHSRLFESKLNCAEGLRERLKKL